MEGVRVRVGKSSDAKNASAVNQRRLQRSTTLNRRFVKKPTQVPRIKASAGAASRTLKNQANKRVLISKGHAVKIQPQEVKIEKQEQAQKQSATQQSAKVVQRAVQQVSTQEQSQQKLASRAASGSVSLRSLGVIEKGQPEAPKMPRKRQMVQVAPSDDPAPVKAAKARIAARRGMDVSPKTAQQLKEQAIQRALEKVSKMKDEEAEAALATKKRFWQKKKFVAAAAMAVVSLALLGYLVGVKKAYPSYIPSSYRLDSLVKEENGRITMVFKNDRDQRFTLMEEKTSWDSSAVLSNYVLKNWGENYTVVKGQGLTIYVSNSNAAWVNGGVLYVIIDDSNALKSSDLHDIAVSL